VTHVTQQEIQQLANGGGSPKRGGGKKGALKGHGAMDDDHIPPFQRAVIVQSVEQADLAVNV
jgi:hypothetical protein